MNVILKKYIAVFFISVFQFNRRRKNNYVAKRVFFYFKNVWIVNVLLMFKSFFEQRKIKFNFIASYTYLK